VTGSRTDRCHKTAAAMIIAMPASRPPGQGHSIILAAARQLFDPGFYAELLPRMLVPLGLTATPHG
jgi:hypothetical protein